MDTYKLARNIRLDAVRMTNTGNSSHIGAVLSMADIMAVLYGQVMNINPDMPKWEDRDRFILSKGHAGAGVYAALAEKGFFDIEELKTHYRDGSRLSGHVSHLGVPGVELSTGSLGHGLPVAAGMAYAARSDGKKHRVYVLLGDGECDEGSNWEAAIFAAHHKLSNLIAIIDYNRMQSLGSVEDTLRLEPFADKWKAFGWRVITVDGHNHDELVKALSTVSKEGDLPLCVIAYTVKGKGVSFMENTVLWHYRSPQGEEYEMAIKELEAGMDEK